MAGQQQLFSHIALQHYLAEHLPDARENFTDKKKQRDTCEKSQVVEKR